MDLLIPTLQVFLVLGTGFGVAILLLIVFRRNITAKTKPPVDYGIFSPGELERLKGMGLLTEEEARRVQSVVARRAVEQVEKVDTQERPLDLNELLEEANRLRREHAKRKQTSEEDSD